MDGYCEGSKEKVGISWHQNPENRIDSYVAPKGCLTKVGMDNFDGDHSEFYEAYLKQIST